MLYPKQFQVNEAWIAFQLNHAPIVTVRDGLFNSICLMDAASCFILGSVMVPADHSEPSALEAKHLFKKSWAHKKEYPGRLFVPNGRFTTDLTVEAKRNNIAVIPVPLSHLQPIIGDVRREYKKLHARKIE